MKKNLSAKLLTVALSVISVFAAAGCGESAVSVSKSEFISAAASSYSNFYKTRVDYDDFADTTVVYDYFTESTSKVDWSYTPDGAESSVEETYQQKLTSKGKIVYSVKNIDSTVFLSLQITEERNTVEYDRSEAPNTAPLTPTYETSKNTYNFFFGMENSVYYAKRESIEQTGEQTLGEPTESKTYFAFADKDAYEACIDDYLSFIKEDYYAPLYAIFSSNGNETMSNYLKDYKVNKGVYSANLDMASAMPQGDSVFLVTLTGGLQYSKNAPVSLIQDMRYSYGETAQMAMKLNVKIDCSSSVKTQANALNGYTLDENFNLEEAKYENTNIGL